MPKHSGVSEPERLIDSHRPPVREFLSGTAGQKQRGASRGMIRSLTMGIIGHLDITSGMAGEPRRKREKQAGFEL